MRTTITGASEPDNFYDKSITSDEEAKHTLCTEFHLSAQGEGYMLLATDLRRPIPNAIV